MNRRWAILLAACVAGAACTHTKTTDDGTEKPEKPAKQAKQAKPKAPEGRDGGATVHPGDRDAMPVATAPEALLTPGADDQIRERLVAQGFLDGDAKPSNAATREGIRRFQRAQDLPATGVADHETVKRLGLDPDKAFRRGTVKD